jgi:hypothetical protein
LYVNVIPAGLLRRFAAVGVLFVALGGGSRSARTDYVEHVRPRVDDDRAVRSGGRERRVNRP